MLSRRQTYAMALMPLIMPLLADCSSSTSSSTTPLTQVQAYSDDLINALGAAATAYYASANAMQVTMVQKIMAELQTLKEAIDAATPSSDIRSTVLNALAFIQQLTPIVTPFLGVAAPYVPLAIAVLQAFVSSLPPPSNAPPTPPAALHAKAMQYHPKS